MKLVYLFLEFARIGLFAFGGAYGAVPLIRDAMISRGWMDESGFMDLIGISESTPGPIMVNAATMAGYGQAGIPGAAVAVLGVVLPSFLIMLVIPRLEKKWGGHRVIRLAMRGVKPCLSGIICATGVYLLYGVLFPGAGMNADLWRNLLILAAAAGTYFLYRKIRKKNISPIVLILLSAVLGMLIF